VFGAVLAIAGVFLVLPLLIVPSQPGLKRAEQLQAQSNVRTAGVQLLAGVFVVGGLYFTARTFRLNSEGQLADRFIRAVEQLGSEARNVRVGGIYALERIAKGSQQDHQPVMEVLCTYLRENSPATRATAGSDFEHFMYKARRVEPDIQAALTVLGRRNLRHEADMAFPVDLRDTNLQGVNLMEVHLPSALLDDARLDGARLERANLREAELWGATFEYATLFGVDFGLAKANFGHDREKGG